MGAPDTEEGNNQSERPQHRVRITRPFYLGVYEVTQEEYEAIAGRNPCYFSSTGPGKDAVKDFDTRRLPVEEVTYNDAIGYCRALSAKEGKKYRLPTEAEWEYARRAGTTTAFSFGTSLNGSAANANGSFPYGTSTNGAFQKRTTVVGIYKNENAFQLYDMHGNLFEWCSDTYDLEYYWHSPVDDPPGPIGGSARVVRGGGWDDPPVACRSATRGACEPWYHDYSIGFRIACECEPHTRECPGIAIILT